MIAAALRAPLERFLFSEDERSIAEIVLELCRTRGLRLATAESCTGGMVAARLTDVPGSSDVVLGGVVAYANEVKTAELGVAGALLDGARRGLGRGGRGDGGRACAPGSAPTSGSRSPASQGRAAARRRSLSVSCTSRRRRPTASGTAVLAARRP